jgi:hypothetical protein
LIRQVQLTDEGLRKWTQFQLKAEDHDKLILYSCIYIQAHGRRTNSGWHWSAPSNFKSVIFLAWFAGQACSIRAPAMHNTRVISFSDFFPAFADMQKNIRGVYSQASDSPGYSGSIPNV